MKLSHCPKFKYSRQNYSNFFVNILGNSTTSFWNFLIFKNPILLSKKGDITCQIYLIKWFCLFYVLVAFRSWQKVVKPGRKQTRAQIIQELKVQTYIIDGPHDIQDWIRVHIFWEDYIIWKKILLLVDKLVRSKILEIFSSSCVLLRILKNLGFWLDLKKKRGGKNKARPTFIMMKPG